MTPNSKGLNEVFSDLKPTKIHGDALLAITRLQAIIAEREKEIESFKVGNLMFNTIIEEQKKEIERLQELLKVEPTWQVENRNLQKEIATLKEKVGRLTEALIAIQNAPGGGPAKRIATQALEDKV